MLERRRLLCVITAKSAAKCSIEFNDMQVCVEQKLSLAAPAWKFLKSTRITRQIPSFSYRDQQRLTSFGIPMLCCHDTTIMPLRIRRIIQKFELIALILYLNLFSSSIHFQITYSNNFRDSGQDDSILKWAQFIYILPMNLIFARKFSPPTYDWILLVDATRV